MKMLSFLFLLASTLIDGSKSYIATVTKDNVTLVTYHVKNDKLIKAIFDDEKRNKKQELNYIYNKADQLIKVSFSGDESVSGSNSALEIKNFNDGIVQQEFVKNKLKVRIPLQAINAGELRDISYLFSAAKTYSNVVEGNKRTLTINNINQSFRFYPSDLDRFIGSTHKLKKYTLILKNDTVVSEEIQFDKGLLKRTYNWKGAKEFNIKINCRYNNNEVVSTVKRILIK